MTVQDIETSFSKEIAWKDHVRRMRDVESMTFTGRHRNKDGSVIPVKVDVDYIQKNGKEFLLAISRSLSEQEDRLKRIESDQTRASLLFDHAPVPLAEIQTSGINDLVESHGFDDSGNTPDDLFSNVDEINQYLDQVTFKAVNDETLKLFGVKNVEQLNKQITNFVSEQTIASFKPLESSEAYEWEAPILDRSGNKHNIHFKAVPAPGSESDFSPMYLSFTDVTNERMREKRLQLSEETFSNLVDSVPGTVYRCRLDRDWTMLFISDNAEELTGYPSSEFIYNQERTYASVIHPEDREKVFETVRDSVKDQDIFEIEYRIKTRNGEIKWVYERGKPVLRNGEVEFLQGVILDVDKKKRIQQKLKQSERRFREMTENMNTLFFFYSGDWDELIYINDVYEELWGRSVEQLHENPQDFLKNIHPEDRGNLERVMEELSRGQEKKVEFRVLRDDGSQDWVLSRGVPIQDEQGEVKRIAGYVEKITDRKKIENKLQEREQRFELLAENVDGIFFVYSGHWENYEYNKKYFENIFGVDAERLKEDSMVFLEGVHPRDREQLESTIENFLDGEEASVEYRVNPEEDYSRWAWTHGFPVTDRSGDVKKIVGYTQEITDRKEAEQELQIFHDLVSQSNDELFIIDPDSAEILEVNERAIHNLGYEKDELLNMKVVDIEEQFDDMQDWERRMKQYNEDGSMDPIEGEHIRKDGTRYPVEVNGRLIEEKGKQYMVSVGRDLTKRKKMREEIRESEQRIRSLVNAQPDLFLIFNRGGQYVDVLTEDHDKLVAPPGELVGSTVHDFFEEELANRFHNHIRTVIDNEQLDVMEYKLEIDGEPCWFEARSVPIRYDKDDEPLAVFVARDITERKQIQNQLEQSQRRFQEMAENIDDIFWLLDPQEDKLLYVSPAYEDIFGRPVGELYEDTTAFLSSVHPDDRERLTQYMQNDRRLNLDIEHRITVEGDVKWINTKTFPVNDDNGEVVRIAGFTQDITEKKNLQQEHEKFFNLTPDLFAIANMEGYFEDVNPSFEEVLGYTKDKLLSTPLLDFVHPEDRSRTERTFQECKEGKKIKDFENRHRTADGNYRWLSWRSVTEDGKIYAVARDVTERREAEEELAYQKSLLEAQQEAAIEGILVTSMDSDSDSIILSHNERFQEIWNIPETILETRSDEEALEYVSKQLQEPESFLEQVQYLYEHPMETSRDELRFKDGRILDRYTSPVESEGEIYGRVWFYRDVTEERQIKKELEQSLKEKETLLEEVHHRVKNNMQIVNSLLRMQSRKHPSETVKSALRDSINRVKSMALIHEKLYDSDDLSNLNFEGYFRELCEYVLRAKAPRGNKPELDLQVDNLDIDLQTAICSGLIINELVSNSLEHGISGESGCIEVSLTKQGHEIVLQVSDNGVGMDEDVEPFNSDSTGMNIIQSLANYELDGDIEIINDNGLTVTVRFEL